MITEKEEFLNDIMAKYAIKSLDDAKEICKGKSIDVEGIIKSIKPDASEDCINAFTLGVAIAIKKDTKLASYVAIDIGEGIQGFIGVSFAEPKSGFDLGFEICDLLKDKEHDNTSLIKDYKVCIPFLDMDNDTLYKVTTELCLQVEAAMK